MISLRVLDVNGIEDKNQNSKIISYNYSFHESNKSTLYFMLENGSSRQVKDVIGVSIRSGFAAFKTDKYTYLFFE